MSFKHLERHYSHYSNYSNYSVSYPPQLPELAGAISSFSIKLRAEA